MPRSAQVLSVLAIAALGIGLLAACGPVTPPGAASTPSRSATSTPAVPSITRSATPSPAPEPAVAAVIEITGSRLLVNASDTTTIVAIPFTTEGAAAVAQLTEALGVTPTLTTRAANYCQPETTVYSWGEFDLHVPAYVTAAPGAVFTVQANGPATAEGLPIRSLGIGVGASLSQVTAAGIYTFDDSFGGITAQVDRTFGSTADDPNAAGALAYITGGVVTDLISPVYYYGDC